MDLGQWLTSALVRSWVVPAVVAAVVALVFEVVFKPSIAVRTERRLDQDRARRQAVGALHALASRAQVVSLTDGPLVRVLQDEVEEMLAEVREVRSAVVRGDEWGKRAGRVVTSSLALIQARGVMLDETAKQLIHAPSVANVIAPASADLNAASDGLLAVAAVLQAERWRVHRSHQARRQLARAEACLDTKQETNAKSATPAPS